MTRTLEEKFDEQAMAVYENGKRLLGYNATRFLQKIRADGGVAAAKSWLRPGKNKKPTNGFLKLLDFGRLDLSLEALVLRKPWSSLFTESELAVARERLTKYGYFLPKQRQSKPRANHELPHEVSSTTFREGTAESVLINRYERNAAARAACIRHYGARCYVCLFEPTSIYGKDFEGVIHVHHLCPLAAVGEDYEVDPIADLRPVCPNCHAIIHHREPCYTIAEVRQFIENQKRV